MNMPASVSHLPVALRNPERTYLGPREGMGGEKKKFVAKGHDSQLQDAQHGRLPVTITTLSGTPFNGTIARRDKYTITLRHNSPGTVVDGQDEIFYKHAIESVLIDRRAAHTSNQE